MMIEKPILNKLKDFGLNTYEAKLWTALLSRGVSTAGELSDIANVPRSRSYDVLESLEKKGFVIMKLGKPIKYAAVPPEEVIERVKRRVKDNAEKQITIINDLKKGKILSELNQLHSQGLDLVQPTDLSGSISGQENVYNHLESRLKLAKSTVDMITTSNSLLTKLSILSAALKKSKPKVRVLTQLTKENIAKARELSNVAEIRHTEKKARFCIIDQKEILFMLLDTMNVHPNYDTCIWVNTEFFSTALKTLFDNEWEKSTPIEKMKI